MSRRKHVVFKLIGSLFTSPYRWGMLAMLLFSFAVNTGMNLWVMSWMVDVTKGLTDSLVERDAARFYGMLFGMLGVVVGIMTVAAVGQYVTARLQMQVRTAMTYPVLRQWLGEEGLYRLEREKRIDNPDQRIADDVQLFLSTTIGLLLSGLSTVGGVWMFSAKLWQEGGALDLNLGGQAWTIPGYLFWFAVAYSIFDFVLTRWIAKPQIGLNMQQQHFEADFRFGLVQVREHAEQVSLYRGAATELPRLVACFEQVRRNWWRLIAYQAGLNAYNTATSQISGYMMFLLLAPRVLTGAATVGTLTSLQLVYGMALMHLNWLANVWPTIVGWIAVVRRLKDMDDAIHQPVDVAASIAMGEADSAELSTQGLVLALPDGSRLTAVGDLCIQPGQRWLVRGPSGTGKSTLVRAIAGLWPHGSGRIEPPRGRLMFLPQKNYLPWDTLKVVLAYPHPADTYSDEACRQALIDCRLPKLAERLHDQDRWNMRLSPGEQQRLAFARALLSQPDFLFLDESTSALDIDTERHLYQLLIERLPGTTLVSVAHRPTLDAFHTHGLELHAERAAKVATLGVPA